MLSAAQKQKIKALCRKYDLYFCVLFGSGSSAKNRKLQRDYDLAFYGGQRLPSDLKLKLYHVLQPLFDKPVDVILVQPLMDPLLAYEISTKGKLVVELQKDSFLSFQTRAWKDYLDSKRYRDYEREYIRRKVKDVS